MENRLVIVDTEGQTSVGDARASGQDVEFPSFIDGWTDILDARHPPYTDQSLEELCSLAHHVRKPYLLVEPSQIEDDEP